MAGPRVSLEWALQWRCPRCRIISFAPAPSVVGSDVDSLRDSEMLEAWEELDEGDDNGEILFMMVPAFVTCTRCGVSYETNLPNGMTELGGDTEEW